MKLALGENWRNFVTDPAEVQGAHQTAATVEEEVPPPSAGPSCSGTLASRAATVEEQLGESQHHSETEFQYQIPNSFEVRRGLCLNHA